MAAPTRACLSCQTRIPGGALCCPSCGAAAPTEIIEETGSAPRAAAERPDDAERRQRLQRALGENFQVGEPLGRGGFAEIYAATDVKLDRAVAVKVLHPDEVVSSSLIMRLLVGGQAKVLNPDPKVSSSHTERFLREARAIARLRHPGIIPIYQVGEAEGLAYYVMPLIAGGSLRAFAQGEGVLPIDEVRRILREVAEALAVVHEAGIVHRDIKPDNIMLEGKERRAVLTDFGVAKALAGSEAGLTGVGVIIGTPHYMSPEQAVGTTIDSRSDIYSLGVVAYQMLAGRLPFEGDSDQEVRLKHVTEPPPSVRAARPDLPDDLVEVIERCLEKQPDRRWQSASQLAARLAGQPPAGVAPTVRPGKRRWWFLTR